jgi:hypothetical protein
VSILDDIMRRHGFAEDSNGECPTPPTPAAPPLVSADEVASIDDLIRAGAEVRWLWPGWIPGGVLTAVAAKGGAGKTRFCADLVRRAVEGLPWPDGTPQTLPPDALALWVVADNHHDEMVSLCQSFGIKDNVRLNAGKSDPYGGVSLDTVDDYAMLEARVKAVSPALVIIDTVGNATDKSLCRQEEAKAFYQPLQMIARRQRCAILCLTHLNAAGLFLGRRVLEKVRVAIRMEQPDPDCERRRLEVVKSNSKRPPPLGLSMGDRGNEYDHTPPEPADEEGAPGTRRGPAGARAADFLRGHLAHMGQRVSTLIERARQENPPISVGSLYKGRKLLKVEEYEMDGRKCWRLPRNADEV